jgi:anti-sigma factor RsiW
MTSAESIRLMHAVLDGAASAEDKAALERLLAADPAARVEFESQCRLFEALSRLPQREPPAGFADGVMSALQRSKGISSPRHQPFSTSGVIGPSASDIIVRKPGSPATTTRKPSGSNFGSQHMSTSRRGLWITGGVAAAVAALFLGGGIQFPTSGENATGTIAPAQRYRAPQPGEAPAGTAIAPQGGPATAGSGAVGAAAGNAANNAANNAAANAANNAAASGARNAASNASR